MNLCYIKDEFGRKRLYLMKPFSYLLMLSSFVFLLVISCQRPDQKNNKKIYLLNEEKKGIINNDIDLVRKINVETVKDNFVAEKRGNKVILGYNYRLEYVETINRKVTCYSKDDPGDPGHGKYANINFADKLYRSERHINSSHFTVALNYDDKEWHENLIQLSGGTWTHKYRFHVPGYNKEKKPDLNHYPYGDSFLGDDYDFKSITDNTYFSIPRDRMGRVWICPHCRKVVIGNRYFCKYCNRSIKPIDLYGRSGENRIDILFTYAGKYNSIKERQKYWGAKKLNIDVYEIVKYPIYSE